MKPSTLSRTRDNLLPIAIAAAVATLLFGGLYLVFDKALSAWTIRDLDNRARLVWRAASTGTPDTLRDRIEALSQDDHIVGIVACLPSGASLVNTSFSGQIDCGSRLVRTAASRPGRSVSGISQGHEIHVVAHQMGAGNLIVVQDRTFITARRHRMLQVLLLGGYAAALAFFVLVRLGVLSGRRGVVHATRELLQRINDGDEMPHELPADFQPLVVDFAETLARRKRLAAQNSEESGPARLRQLIANAKLDASLVVVANREPYSHERDEDGALRIKRPPSGLVTGVEPLLRATGGTWIAHGSGVADREFSDADGRLPVPPERPEYTLRRLWLSEEEHDGYYLGFANEGLWPLCHIAHTRPTFRSSDWHAYQSVNEKFARATVAEGPANLVLVQDYHFALVPRLVRELAPQSALSLFWHIPWPNSEVIGICPWKEQLLDGMLGADVLGFHTRFHCLNFLETVQRYLECRVDLASMSVEYRGEKTLVRQYPISVEWPYPAATREAGAALRASLGIARDVHVTVGVERADYTKGLLERVEAVEALLTHHPELTGKYVLVQLAAPSRTRIKKYRDLTSELEEAVHRVNRRFGTDTFKPIHLQVRGFSPEEVRVYYAMADSALVTPLHDGMNLVAKEYVASCGDAKGVLILSQFAGAAQELDGALIVNPYDADATAAAIARAIHMPMSEKRARMMAMREQVSKNSIYDWSAKMLRDLIDVRARRARLWPIRNAASRQVGVAG